MFAPNAPLRPVVTALTSQPAAADPAAPSSALSEVRGTTSRQPPPDEKPRRPAVYLWAMLSARIYELFPLVCSRCGAEMEIIAFITKAPRVRAILTHIGEPCEPPLISPCRGPPEWEMLDQTVEFDPIHPEPDYELDQRVNW